MLFNSSNFVGSWIFFFMLINLFVSLPWVSTDGRVDKTIRNGSLDKNNNKNKIFLLFIFQAILFTTNVTNITTIVLSVE